MRNNTRRQTAAVLIASYPNLFKCPICSGPLNAEPDCSLRCPNRHCFDISKSGYVHLLPRPVASDYGKSLFKSRRKVMQSGFFDPLHRLVSDLLTESLAENERTSVILDAGCGEGFHLSNIRERLARGIGKPALGVGLDIAKEGIALAAGNDPASLWCVADLAACPLMDNRFDAILNILSPAHYAESSRLLKRDGRMIKVIPEPGYLRELRDLLHGPASRREYSNAAVRKRFASRFELTDVHRLCRTVRMDRERLGHLVRMTPLSWRTEPERLRRVLEADALDVTVDLTVLVGRPQA